MPRKKKVEEKVEDQKDLMAEIKKMEAEKRQKAMKEASVDKSSEKMSFDTWWMLRVAKIPRGHLKEVIRADFRGRKLSDKETVEEFDKALTAYGLKL